MLKKSLTGLAMWFPVVIMIALLILTTCLLPESWSSSDAFTIWTMLAVGLGMIVLIVILTWLFTKLYQWKKGYFYLALSLLILVPRIIWIAWLPTDAVSDYYYYNVIASYVADQNSWSVLFDKGILFYAPYFTHILNFSNVLSVVYKLFGNSYFVGQLFNIFLTGLTGVLLYITLAKRFSRNVATSAALIFAIWPAYFLYSTLLGTEPLFLFLFVLSIYLYLKIEENGFSPLWALLLALTLICMNMIRPLAAVVLIAFVITALIVQKDRRKTLKAYSIVIILFVLFSLGQSTINRLVYHIPTSNSSLGYSLFVGANEKSGGQWAKEDANQFWKLYNDTSLTNSEVDKELMSKGITRYKDMAKDGDLVSHMKNKYIHYSDENYGYNWNVYSQAGFVWYHSDIILMICNVFMYVMLAINFVAAILALILRKIPSIYLFTLFQVGFTLSGLLVEVQGRYHIPLIIGYSVLAAWGLNEIRKLCLAFVPKKKKKRQAILTTPEDV
ncbi:ArnT family glycosyltransferase [Listeria booriae]|uniref:Phospholipid carrier-dependent glycosyltransferase n=1 Tax=Listeria booriae TaxID=1552123 RepID=A0A841WCY8_9LIST|nr:glycosyltransferase family 39 protein [Listeria booriae]MBC1230862.1 phospholipid carrier-dependent glycosyltransferase [Listeria booriae]MBC1308607.1 phospholipid carrier-dependent glycosyltransferase [Listeria booriae]MBC2242065.1 phospholipid carrier-dependent glycosyltransferase [Listeria booriae]MBC2390817.1 phospholipid carrier-dependent glycosyltransferase [Listeria booriae]